MPVVALHDRPLHDRPLHDRPLHDRLVRSRRSGGRPRGGRHRSRLALVRTLAGVGAVVGQLALVLAPAVPAGALAVGTAASEAVDAASAVALLQTPLLSPARVPRALQALYAQDNLGAGLSATMSPAVLGRAAATFELRRGGPVGEGRLPGPRRPRGAPGFEHEAAHCDRAAGPPRRLVQLQDQSDGPGPARGRGGARRPVPRRRRRPAAAPGELRCGGPRRRRCLHRRGGPCGQVEGGGRGRGDRLGRWRREPLRLVAERPWLARALQLPRRRWGAFRPWDRRRVRSGRRPRARERPSRDAVCRCAHQAPALSRRRGGRAAGVGQGTGERQVARPGYFPAPGQILGEVLRESDNTAMELLTKELGLREGGTGSTRAGVAAVRADLAADGLPLGEFVNVDGSGLSPQDRVTCALLAAALERAGPTACS